jgi:type-F conjugative transfer system pilin assembly protein TrbC
MLKPLVISLLVVASFAPAHAQQVYQPVAADPSKEKVLDLNSAEFKEKTAKLKKDLPLNVTPETVGSNLSPEERKRLEDLANAVTDKTMQRYATEGKKYESQALEMKRRADDIADEALAGSRDKVLKFLGINPKGDSNLYYFVSFSMPVDMLRSYVLDAMWSGGTIVVRGVPPGRSIKDFFTEDLRQLIYGKGASANISLDPRLFEAYGIEAVPAIVYTEDRTQLTCVGSSVALDSTGNSGLSYDTCGQVDPRKYWKISGAVTSDYALRAFVEQGAKGAQPYHDALRKGMAPGMTAPKTQQAFAGDWKDAVSPDDIMAGKQAIEAARKQQAEKPQLEKQK